MTGLPRRALRQEFGYWGKGLGAEARDWGCGQAPNEVGDELWAGGLGLIVSLGTGAASGGFVTNGWALGGDWAS